MSDQPPDSAYLYKRKLMTAFRFIYQNNTALHITVTNGIFIRTLAGSTKTFRGVRWPNGEEEFVEESRLHETREDCAKAHAREIEDKHNQLERDLKDSHRMIQLLHKY
jgi:hypothetical protein